MYREKIVDASTGEETWRDYTPEEIAEVEKAKAEAQAELEVKAQFEAKRQLAISKLNALGLDLEDLKALGL